MKFTYGSLASLVISLTVLVLASCGGGDEPCGASTPHYGRDISGCDPSDSEQGWINSWMDRDASNTIAEARCLYGSLLDQYGSENAVLAASLVGQQEAIDIVAKTRPEITDCFE